MGRSGPSGRKPSIKLPDDDKITIAWVLQNVPARWWAVGLAAVASVALAAFALGTITAVAVGSYQLRQVEADVGELSARKESLKAQVIALEVQKEVDSMTPQQVREALKKWAIAGKAEGPAASSTVPVPSGTAASAKP